MYNLLQILATASNMKDKMQGFRRLSQVIVLKTKQDAARKELRFINQTRKKHFDTPSYMYIYTYILANLESNALLAFLEAGRYAKW